jgi:cysteine synthase
MIYASAVETVGGTPLVELSRLARGLGARIVGKLEMSPRCGWGI